MSTQPHSRLPAIARRRWTIGTQLATLVLAVALPAAGLVTYALRSAAEEAREAAYARVHYLAASSASQLDFVIRDDARLLATLAARPRVRALDARHCDPILASLVTLNPLYTTLGLRDRTGRVVCSSRADPLGAHAVAQFPWFREGIASRRPTVGDAFLHPKTGRWVSVLTHPLADDDGSIVGLLGLSIDLPSLQARLFDALPAGSLVSVLDRHDRFLMRSIGGARWIGQPLPPEQAARIRSRRSGETFETTGVDGVRRLYAMADVPGAGWRVFAALPRDAVLAAHRERVGRSTAFGIGVLVLVVGLALGIGRAIAHPIGALARTAAALARDAQSGNGHALETEGSAEIEAVAEELRRLAGERERSREERAALVAHYETLLKSARDIYLLVDREGRIVDWNDAALSAYGYAAGELRGKPLIELRSPRSRASYAEDWRKTDAPGGGSFETVHQRRDGTCFDVEVSASLVLVDGAPHHQAFVRDITARKAAEEQLRRQNAELDRFNRAAVDREMDLIALKRRVNELSRDLGREPPYPMELIDRAPGEPAGGPHA